MSSSKLDKILEDLVDVKVNIAEINQTLKSQHASLDYHILRSDSLEEQVDILKVHVHKAHGAKEFIIFSAKVLAGLAALVAVVAFVVKIKMVL